MESVSLIHGQELKIIEVKLEQAHEMYNRECNNSMNTMHL